jgi:endonuclease/exonuclease/phosphatase family metal-dependent hydrolase
VVTYNVLAAQYADCDARYARIAEGLRELDADVVALQEVPVGQHVVGHHSHTCQFACGTTG